MNRVAEYVLFFVATVLLQVLLFDNINISSYLYPLFYVAFIVLLPVDIKPAVSIISSFLLGVSVDLLSGTVGLGAIASTATAFVRPAVINVTIGREVIHETGMPSPSGRDRGRWLRYAVALIAFHCTVFFLFEAATFKYIWFTLLRILGSVTVTSLLVWAVASLVPIGRARSGQS